MDDAAPAAPAAAAEVEKEEEQPVKENGVKEETVSNGNWGNSAAEFRRKIRVLEMSNEVVAPFRKKKLFVILSSGCVGISREARGMRME